jgi:hypothetical protein
MPNQRSERSDRSPKSPQPAPATWTRPSFELIPLDCEITAYAPDGDQPLF